MGRRFSQVLVLLALLGGATTGAAAAETRPFGRGSLDEIVRRHQGAPTIIAFWSLTCPPCIAEMALWRDTLAQRPGLRLVLVATDPIEDQTRIERTLERHGLDTVESWAFADPFVERLRFDVDRRWRGELPRTYLIGRDGERTAHSGVIPAPTLEAWLAREGGG